MVRGRRVVLSLFTAGLAGVVALTTLGARDKPASQNATWSIREQGGAVLVLSSDRCVTCHGPDKVAPAIEPGRIGKSADWIAAHVEDPEVIAPGIREAPKTNEGETKSILAALAKLRTGPPPPADTVLLRVYTVLAKHCMECHKIDGAGGTDGPDLTHAGEKLDADTIERRMIDPKQVKTDAEMPAFGDKLSLEDIRAVAGWLAGRK